MSTAKRAIRALIVATVAFFILAGAASASNHCGGGNGGGSVPLGPDWLMAVMVAGMLGYGAYTLRASTQTGRSAAVVIALMVLLTVSGMPRAEAGSDCPPETPPTSWTAEKLHEYHESNPTLVDWWHWSEYKGGRDRTCGPNSSGDGWFCSSPVPNGVRYIAGEDVPGSNAPDNYCAQMTFGVHRSSTLTGSKSFRRTHILSRSQPTFNNDPSWCSYPDNTTNPDPFLGRYPPTDRGEWVTREFFEGGYYWGGVHTWYWFNGNEYSRDSVHIDDWYRINDEKFLLIDTVGNDNLEPVMELLAPIGEQLHRQGAVEHVQPFEMRATDEDGHDWTAEVELTHPDSTVETFAANGDGDDEYSAGETAVLEVEMPHKDGTYSWRAKPTDTSGESNAEGEWTGASTFSFIYNLAPEIPTRLVPESGEAVREGRPVTFVIETTDPEQDSYQGTIQVRPAGNENPATRITLETTEAASGDPAAAQLTQTLSPGQWEWRAKATDLLGKDSEESPFHTTWQAFEVTRTVSNEPPAPPTLVAPADAHTFSAGDPQEFTINAVDPEGGDYFGVITATDSTGEETTFTTELVASGQNSSGSPPIPLDGGTYQWSGVAVDTRGATSNPSVTRTFDVAAANAPGAPTLVEPAEGHEFEHNDVQRFTVNAADPQGGLYQAEVRVDGEVVCETPFVPSGEDASCAPFPQIDTGAHVWDARASDPEGNSGPWSAPANFTVLANRAPDAPALVRPDDNATFAVGEPQVFAVNATDPDGDSYHGVITATNVDTGETSTFETAPSPSGSDSYGSPSPPLEPGQYTWGGPAVDVAGAEGDPSVSRSFTVNRAPATPTQVSPDPGRAFGANEPQLFTINATDPDGDPYHGRIEFRDAATLGALPDHTFETARALSGEDSIGTPSEPLPSGDFEWRAVAVDPFGSESDPSGWRPVSVAGSSSTSSSSTTTTTAPPGSQAGAGPVTGRVELTDPGLPPILAPCEPSTFTFTSNATGVAFDVDGTAFAGSVAINGDGGSDCENAGSGQGTLSVSAEGFGPGSANIDCLSLEGGYERLGTFAQIVLRGDCEINDTATSPVVVRTAINLEPDDPEAPTSGRIMGADFTGAFTMEPV